MWHLVKVALVTSLVAGSLVVANPAGAQDEGKTRHMFKTKNSGIETQLSKKVQSPAPKKTLNSVGQAVRTAVKTDKPIALYVGGGCRDGVRNEFGSAAVACRATQPDPDNGKGEKDDKPVDALTVAQQVASRLNLVTPTLKTSPEAPTKALVGLETWLWIPGGQWRPLTDSVQLGGTTVTVTARPVQTRWNMGEATEVCPDAGRVWRKGLGKKAKTTCGYTYQRTSAGQPGKTYRVSAVIRYAITWTCQGDCTQGGGNLGMLDSPTDTTDLQVGERHAVIIN